MNPPDPSRSTQIIEQDRAANPAYADGFADGEAYRARRQAPPAYLLVGFDEYAQGFQAGFYADDATTSRLGAACMKRANDE